MIYLKNLLKRYSFVFDKIIVLVVIPAAGILLLYRKYGSHRLPLTTLALKKIGVFPIIDHYYEPLFNDKHLRNQLDKERFLPGLDLNIDGQISFLERLNTSEELRELRLNKISGNLADFHLPNGSFESGDGEFLYQILRHIKPKKFIEIGSGNSTKIARMALLKNAKETRTPVEHICIEPYEQPWLENLTEIKVIRESLESLKIDWATELKAGDVLFIDSSHIIRPQGDVLKEYLEIIPLLNPGVYVHVHDIFTPRDYIAEWVIERVRFWNEQYLLEALLTNTNRYEIVAALNYLKYNHFEKLYRVCPYLTKESDPRSFYFKVKG